MYELWYVHVPRYILGTRSNVPLSSAQLPTSFQQPQNKSKIFVDAEQIVKITATLDGHLFQIIKYFWQYPTIFFSKKRLMIFHRRVLALIEAIGLSCRTNSIKTMYPFNKTIPGLILSNYFPLIGDLKANLCKSSWVIANGPFYD